MGVTNYVKFNAAQVATGIAAGVANRAVIFDSNMVHGGHTATDQKTRVLINFNYEI